MPHYLHADITNAADSSPWKPLSARGEWKAALEQASSDPTGAYLLNKRRKNTERPYAIELTGVPHTLTQATPEVVFYSTGDEELQIVRSASGSPAVDTDVDVQLVNPNNND